MKHTPKRLMALLLALALTAGLFSGLGPVTVPLAAATGDYYDGETSGTAGTTKLFRDWTGNVMDVDDTVALPITIYNYDNDGMLFEYAQATEFSNKTVSTNEIAAPSSPYGEYVANASFADAPRTYILDTDTSAGANTTNYTYVRNGAVDYTIDPSYVQFSGNRTSSTTADADVNWGYGFGARMVVEPYHTPKWAPADMRYLAIRYQVARDGEKDGAYLNVVGYSGKWANANLYWGEQTAARFPLTGYEGHCQEDGTTQGADWVETIIDLQSFYLGTIIDNYPGAKSNNGTVFSSYNWETTSNVIGKIFLALDAPCKNIGTAENPVYTGRELDADAVNIAYAAFFPSYAAAQAYQNQVKCYENNQETCTYTVDAHPTAAVGTAFGNVKTVAAGTSVTGTEAHSVEGGSTVSEPYVTLTSTGSNYAWGLGFRALLLNNSDVALQPAKNVRYAAVRYRVKDFAYDSLKVDTTAGVPTSMPVYLMEEWSSLGYYSRTDITNYYANGGTVMSSFDAEADGEWHYAVVDFADYISQYPSGEKRYYATYDNSKSIGRYLIGGSYDYKGTRLDVAYVSYFGSQAEAQSFNSNYEAYLAGQTSYQDVYTAAKETISYSYVSGSGNNQSFSLVTPSSGNSGTATTETSPYRLDSVTMRLLGRTNAGYENGYSNLKTSFTGISGDVELIIDHAIGTGGMRMGMTEFGLVNGQPRYRPDVVIFLAKLLKGGLEKAEKSGSSYNYSFIRGEKNAAKYGTDANGKALDLAQWLRNHITDTSAPTAAQYEATAAKNLIGAWDLCKGNITTYTDAAYYMLNNLFTDDGLGNRAEEYEYLNLVSETRDGKSYYVFDGGYTDVDYNYREGYIKNRTTENGTSEKYGYWYGSDTFTTLYPFLPIREGMTSYNASKSQNLCDAGVSSVVSNYGSYNDRDYNYVMEGHGYFTYDENEEQYFTFSGDDDVYLFINGQLVLDVGGAHAIWDETISINSYVNAARKALASNVFALSGENDAQREEKLAAQARAQALALEDGKDYPFEFFYMERHGVGSNIRIETNIKIKNDMITTAKGAFQDGVELNDYAVIDVTKPVEYYFTITNNGESTLRQLQFHDPAIGFSANYDTVTLNAYTQITDLRITLTNPSGPNAVNQSFAFTTEAALADFLKDLGGRGFRPGDTLKLSGVKYELTAAEASQNVFPNTVTVYAGSIPGNASFHVVPSAGTVSYYAWKGRPLTLSKSDVVAAAGMSNPSAYYRSTASGSELADTNEIRTNGENLSLTYNKIGAQQLYFSNGNRDQLIHATVYVFDTPDSAYVLDYDGKVELGRGSDQPFNANALLSISGLSTKTTYEALTTDRPVYADNHLTLSPYWDLFREDRDPLADETSIGNSVTITLGSHMTTLGGALTQENLTAPMQAVTVVPDVREGNYFLSGPVITGEGKNDLTVTSTSATQLFADMSKGGGTGGGWLDANARIGVCFRSNGDSSTDTWVEMEQVYGTVYSAAIPAGNWSQIFLARFAPETASISWSGTMWNQTYEIPFDAGAHNYLIQFSVNSNSYNWNGDNINCYTISGSLTHGNASITFGDAVRKIGTYSANSYNNYNGSETLILCDAAERLTGSKTSWLSDNATNKYYFAFCDTDDYTTNQTGAGKLTAYQRGAVNNNATYTGADFVICIANITTRAELYNALTSTDYTPVVEYNGVAYNDCTITVWDGDFSNIGKASSGGSSEPALEYDMKKSQKLNGAAEPAVGVDINNSTTVVYNTDGGYVSFTDTKADYWAGFGGTVRVWNSGTAKNLKDLRYVAIKYKTNVNEPIYLVGSWENLAAATTGDASATNKLNQTNRNKLGVVAITPTAADTWQMAVVDLKNSSIAVTSYPDGEAVSDAHKYQYTFSTGSFGSVGVKSLFLCTSAGAKPGNGFVGGETVDLEYIAFFDNEAAATAYNTSHAYQYIGREAPWYSGDNGRVSETPGTNSFSFDLSQGSFTAALDTDVPANTTLSFTPGGIMDGASTLYLTTRVCDSATANETKYLGQVDVQHEVEMYQAITVVPANVVYYEDNNGGIKYNSDGPSSQFSEISITTVLSDSEAETRPETAQSADQSGNQGYDAAWALGGDNSGGAATAIRFTGTGELLHFDFTGTGFDLFGRTDAVFAPTVVLKVYDGGTLVKTQSVITEFTNYNSSASDAIYQIPVASVDLTAVHAEAHPYHVVVEGVAAVDMTGWKLKKHSVAQQYVLYYTDPGTGQVTQEWLYARDSAGVYYQPLDKAGTQEGIQRFSPAAVSTTFYLDGVRVYNSLKGVSEDESSMEERYYSASEQEVSFREVRDLVLAGKAFAAQAGDDAALVNLGDFDALWEVRNDPENFTVTERTGTDGAMDSYFYTGPNNELYLQGVSAKQALVLLVRPDSSEGAKTLQIAARTLNASSTASGFASGDGKGKLELRTTDAKGWRELAKEDKAPNESCYALGDTEAYFSVDLSLCPTDGNGNYVVLLRANGANLSLTKLKFKGVEFLSADGWKEYAEPEGSETEPAPEAGTTALPAPLKALRRVVELLTSGESYAPTVPETVIYGPQPADEPEEPTPAWLHSQGESCVGAAFADMPAYGHWAHRAIDWAVETGITKGTSETSFSPADYVTRAQVVTLLYRAAGEPPVELDESPFADVRAGSYYERAVQWAVQNGVTKGTSATSFTPERPCTRGEIVTLLYRFAQAEAEAGENPFEDVAKSAFYYNAVLWAVEQNVTKGVSPERFAPDQTCTRAQAVTFLYRLIQGE